MKSSRQTTLRSQVTVTGIGVHSGSPVSVTIGPAEINSGFVFTRADREVAAIAASVIATNFATVLGDHQGPLVSTAEHVLAALRGMGVDNATIEVDGPEVPIMDGSAAPFVDAIDRAGIAEHEIDFANSSIGRQAYAFDLDAGSFRRDICRARTFGCVGDVNKLWSAGYALGASLENSVVFDDTRVLNTEGLRYADECVRHKVLDVVGDLALAGLPLIGLYRSVRGGHKLNHAVLTALMADRHAWRIVEAIEPVLERPVVARRAVRGHADVAGGMVAVAYGPDVS